MDLNSWLSWVITIGGFSGVITVIYYALGIFTNIIHGGFTAVNPNTKDLLLAVGL